MIFRIKYMLLLKRLNSRNHCSSSRITKIPSYGIHFTKIINRERKAMYLMTQILHSAEVTTVACNVLALQIHEYFHKKSADGCLHSFSLCLAV